MLDGRVHLVCLGNALSMPNQMPVQDAEPVITAPAFATPLSQAPIVLFRLAQREPTVSSAQVLEHVTTLEHVSAHQTQLELPAASCCVRWDAAVAVRVYRGFACAIQILAARIVPFDSLECQHHRLLNS